MPNKAQFELTTQTSYYDNFLNEKDLHYMQKAKNLTGEVVMMSPKEYFREAAKIFNTSVEALIEQRTDNSLSKYIEDMQRGDVFPLCYLNYAGETQEGLHRMLAAAEAFGWDIKYPVLVVEPYDKELWKYYEDLQTYNSYLKYDLEDVIRSAENKLADWSEPVPDDFVDIMKAEIENIASQTGDDIDVDVDIEDDNRVVIHLNRYNDITPDTAFACEYKLYLDDMFDIDIDDLEEDV